MEQTELRQELIKTMNEISSKMRDHILLNYFDKLGDDKKYVLSMMIEAYQTVDVFCYAMQNTSLTITLTITMFSILWYNHVCVRDYVILPGRNVIFPT